MIVDSLANASSYEKLGQSWKAAFDYLKQAMVEFPSEGRHDIDGDRVYASVQLYETSPMEERKWEAHRKYVDIQYIFEGNECIGYTPLENIFDADDYSEKTDCVLAKNASEYVMIPLHSGSFGIFFPQDAHKPRCILDKKENIKKILIKLKID